jgi:TolB-like protein
MSIADPVPLSFEGFTLDPAARTLADAGGESVPLRRSEFELLLAFVEKPGRALSRDYLLEAVAGRHSEAFDRSIDVLVGRVRWKIEREPRQPRLILTVPGVGYRFAAKPHRVPLRNEVTATVTADAASITRPTVPRLSIVVMPFINLSNDSAQEYLADGISDDLTTDLSRIHGSFVISRSTAFTYKGKPVDAKQIGGELGVRYVLEGSLRRSGNQVRVNAQRIDAETNSHLWAERFDHDIGDLFALQDEIASRIAIELNLELVGAEAARQADHPDVLDYILRGRAAHSKPPTPDKYIDAIGLFERALALDPRSVEAQSRLAIELTAGVLDQMSTSTAAHIARAEGLVGQALEAAPRSPLAHFAKGQVLRAQRRYAEAIAEYETAITFDRNRVHALGPLAECKLFAGSIDETIPLVERAIGLSPRDPFIAIWYFRIGRVHLLQSRTDEAIVWLEKARGANPELPYVHADLASAYALRGETERSAVELAEARRLSLDGRYSSIFRLQATGHYGVPRICALYETTLFAGLRTAGMPEQ